ncbi:MAG: polysaccharide biosynthesis/export family protein [Candidatus Sulfotelmatobacter sp.]|jgi:polysaccharide export outer membrane protein
MAPMRWLGVLLAVSAACAAQADKAAAPTATLVATPNAAASTTPAPAASDTVVASKPANGDFQQRAHRYRIEAGDTFDLNFDLSPEFNQLAVAVQPDGYVTLRGVGDLKVAGQTVPELTQTLRGAYSKILNDPLISVVLKEFEKPYFVADGQVAKPGKYEMHGEMTLTQAVAIAGGFQSSAKHSQVLLFRRVDDQWTEAKLIDVKKMQKNGNLSEDPFLHSGDMVFVPKNVMSKIDRFIPNLSMGTYLPLALP